MTVEFNDTFPGSGMVEGLEHSVAAKAKRVTPGAVTIAVDPSNPNRSFTPVIVASGASFQLLPNKLYRIVSAAGFNIALYNGATPVVATGADYFVGPGEAVIISSAMWSAVAVFGTAPIQVVEVV